MKKIIQNGRLEKYRENCPICNCVFEYDKRDIEIYKDRNTEHVYKIFVECPFCQNKIYLNVDNNTFDFLKNKIKQ